MNRTAMAAMASLLILATTASAWGGNPTAYRIHKTELHETLEDCVEDPATCTLPLPVTVGGSCTVTGPAGAICTYTCGGGETQRVRVDQRYGHPVYVEGRAECSSAVASCYSPGWGPCIDDSDIPAQGVGTFHGTCTVLWADSFVRCSSGGAAVAPDPPQSPSFQWTSSTGGVLSWSPPAFSGGSPVTQYAVYAGTAPVPVGVTASTSFPITGLNPDAVASYRITATNAVGEGPAVWYDVEGNTSCHVVAALCEIQCVPGAVLRVYAYDSAGQLQGNPIHGSVECGTESASCSGTNSCQSVSAPNGASVSDSGLCRALTPKTYVTCGAGNVPVMPSPPTGFTATPVYSCPQSWDPSGMCVALAWAPPAYDGGAPVDGYLVYRTNWYGTGHNGGWTGEWPYATCGPTCILDVTGCDTGDKYWAVAIQDHKQGPPSNVATVTC
jgi:hypothetical protein